MHFARKLPACRTLRAASRRAQAAPRRASPGPAPKTWHAGRGTRNAKIIDLRRDGHTYVQISSAIGVPPIETPDVQVGQLYLRMLERRAKLYGLDLPTGEIGTPHATAEMLAEVFGFDRTEDPIDVEAVEETLDDREARGLGSGD